MKFMKLLIIFCVIFPLNLVLAKSIEEQFSDVQNLMEIDQNKEALELLKTIDPNTNEEIAKQSYLLGKLYFSLQKFQKQMSFSWMPIFRIQVNQCIKLGLLNPVMPWKSKACRKICQYCS